MEKKNKRLERMAMKKEKKSFLVGILSVFLVVGVLATGYFGYKAFFGEEEEVEPTVITQPGQTVIVQQPPTVVGGLVYTDLSGNLMDKAKFTTDQANSYAGIASQAVKFYDITKNPNNDPRTNILAVPDFQIVSSSSTNGALSATKKGIAGHTYVYYFENTTGSYYDVTGTVTIPANINAYAPAFDIGNVLAPAVGTLKTYNSSNLRTDNTDATGHAILNGSLEGSTASTDYRIEVGSQTYAEFLRIWGEYSSTATKADLVGVSVIQKSGPTVGVVIDTSDEKNPIITVNELSAQYPLTFTFYLQGQSSMSTLGNYTLYADDWNAVPGKFGSKIDSVVVTCLGAC